MPHRRYILHRALKMSCLNDLLELSHHCKRRSDASPAEALAVCGERKGLRSDVQKSLDDADV